MANENLTLMDILTDQIVNGHLPVEDAREIVLRREFYRLQALREHGPFKAIPKLKEIEAQAIRESLERNHWHRRKTSEELGINRRTLCHKIREMRLEEEAIA